MLNHNGNPNSDIENGRFVIQKEIECLEKLLACIDENFNKATDVLYSAKGRIIVTGMGKSGHIARKISATLASTGTPSFFIHPSEAGHGDLGMISPQDLLIMLSNSGQTAELAPIIAYCKRFSIKIIALTSNARSALALASYITLLLPDMEEACDIPAPTTSSTAMLALGDALAIALYKRRNFSSSDFHIFHPGGNLGARLLTLDEIMAKEDSMPLVTHHTTIHEAINEMTAKKFGCVGIVNDINNLIGIITDGDLRRNINKVAGGCMAVDIMTKNPKTLTKDTFAQEAMALMSEHKITNIFIVENGVPIGILHMHHLLKIGVL